MATSQTIFNYQITYPKTDGAGTAFNQVIAKFAETIGMTVVNAIDYPATAGQTGIDIMPPTFVALDHIMVIPKMETTSADANKYEFAVFRTDSGAKVNDHVSKGFPVSFALESGDTAMTLDNTDGTNPQVFTVVHMRRA